MTTYNTYQEAKIANPEVEIVTTASEWSGIKDLTGKFEALVNSDDDEREACHIIDNKHGWKICNPADYCMTVEKFLADGRKFVNGDWFINYGGLVVNVGRGALSVAVANAKQRGDSRSYILRAAALEERKPRTKVEYVKREFSHAWEAVKAFEDGEVFHTHFMTDGWVIVEHVQQVIPNLQVEKLYRRIETPMTEREAFIDVYGKVRNEFANQSAIVDFCEFMYNSGKFKLVN